MTNRVVAYVDGFNLYYGLKSKGWQRYYWLDVRHLAENLLRPGQSLEAVRYFTARIRPQPNDPGKPARQDTYLQALATLPDLRIHYGYYLAKNRRCSQCGAAWQTHEEKMTDVNMAVEMLATPKTTLSTRLSSSPPTATLRVRYTPSVDGIRGSAWW